MLLRGIIVAMAAAAILSSCAKTPSPPEALPPPAPVPSAAPREVKIPGQTPAGSKPKVVNHGPRTVNTVAITFDADMTDSMLRNLSSGRVSSYANLRVLDILQRQAVPATFFLTGLWISRYPEVSARIAADSRFELANHTYRHSAYTSNCYTLPQLPRTGMTDDAKRTFDVIRPLGGNQTRYFRFPGLCHDTPALMALAPLGVTVIDGDVISGDPFATSSEPIVNAVLSRVQPGSIIILHITEANAAYTDEALGPILKGLAAKGLTPVRLSELLGA